LIAPGAGPARGAIPHETPLAGFESGVHHLDGQGLVHAVLERPSARASPHHGLLFGVDQREEARLLEREDLALGVGSVPEREHQGTVDPGETGP